MSILRKDVVTILQKLIREIDYEGIENVREEQVKLVERNGQKYATVRFVPKNPDNYSKDCEDDEIVVKTLQETLIWWFEKHNITTCTVKVKDNTDVVVTVPVEELPSI